MSIAKEEQRCEPWEPGSLRTGPVLPGHTIQQDEARHIWIIDQTVIPCSLAEYGCLQVLVEQANRCVPFAHLVEALPEAGVGEGVDQQAERERLRHVLSNLRTKIWMLGMEIISVRGVGYLLQVNEPASAHSDESTNGK